MGLDRLRIRAGVADFIPVFLVAALVSDELAAGTYALLGINIALNVLYHGVMELTVGRSFAKKWVGLEVVSVDGTKPTNVQIVVRTIARVIDILPNLYIVSLIVVRAEPGGSQRIGDHLAQTKVRSVIRALS